jgi:hypothetical protein
MHGRNHDHWYWHRFSYQQYIEKRACSARDRYYSGRTGKTLVYCFGTGNVCYSRLPGSIIGNHAM